MKLAAAVKLKPGPVQEVSLRETLERCNAACTWLAAKGFEAGALRQFDLHKLAYRDLRDRFGLTAQAAVRCIAKVADAFKINRKVAPVFRRYAAQPYDDRIVRFVRDGTAVSIWTVNGRLVVPCVTGDHQRRLLAFRKGECDLMLVRGKWYLACTCDVPEVEGFDPEDWLGVDLGIVNLLTTSDGENFSGADIERARLRHARRRAALQAVGTKAAKRRLKKLAGREQRFRAAVNHKLSRALVRGAERSRRGLALEDLAHIRKRVQARRSQRARLHGWAFDQLRQFVAYEAALAGVPVVFVDPRDTSKACSECGTVDKRNRPDQATFSCVSCGHAAPADQVAARNIRARAAVNRPCVLAAAWRRQGKAVAFG